MEIDNWKLLTAFPPLIVWTGLFFYLRKINKQVTKINLLVQEMGFDQKKNE